MGHFHRCPDCSLDVPCPLNTCTIDVAHSSKDRQRGQPLYCHSCWSSRKDEPPDPDNYHFITDRLAVGAVAARVTPGFCAVVSILATTPWDEQTGAPPVPEGVPVLMVDVMDGHAGLDAFLSEACAFISRHIEHGCVLIHCGAGKSRSVSVCAAYLCRYAGMSLDQALWLISQRRPNICPWDGFKQEITTWLKLNELAQRGPRQ